MTTSDALKERAGRAIAAVADDLVALASDLHSHPELAFEEHRASAAIDRFCARRGFDTQHGIADLDTAVKATAGADELAIAFCAEYDALPEIGHACGHNLIAGASVGAAVGLASVSHELDVSVTVLGTPAEERGGGKIRLLDAGAFDGISAVLMAHPAPLPFDLAHVSTAAVAQQTIRYTGRAAHAAVSPDDGLNAADALTVAQVGIGLLRQHLRAGHQVHGITTYGGDAPNVIPAHTCAEYYIRAPDLDGVAELRKRVDDCFGAGAMATGCSHEIEAIGAPYGEMRSDAELAALYQANAESFGRTVRPLPPGAVAGSTDLGNVSHVIPSIHPIFGLDRPTTALHRGDFTPEAATPEAYTAMLQVARILAFTAIDAASQPTVRDRLLAGASRSRG